jgi:hypothetical protein
MKPSEDLYSLIAELNTMIGVLQKISVSYDERQERWDRNERSQDDAIIFSDIVVTFYTGLETVFFRISQYFENSLNRSQWHREVLLKMILDIPKVRRRVISDDTHSDLDELRRFRHFKRYYFDLTYDWDRLDLVRKKFLHVRGRVIDELKEYTEYLTELAERIEG